MKKIGLVANLEKPRALVLARQILKSLKGVRFLLEEELGFRLRSPKHALPLSEMARKVDLIIVLGGDGTVLRVVRHVYPTVIPILPVNLGRLGFLTSLSPNDLTQNVGQILRGRREVSSRKTLEVEIRRAGGRRIRHVVLNDVVVSRKAFSRVAEMDLWVNGEFLNSYYCDGMIFSTPTGSTAYSLSAGGPIIALNSDVFAITPICPHTLSNRSVVVDDRSVVQLRPTSEAEGLIVTIDGQVLVELQQKDVILVRRSRFQVKLVTLPRHSYFDILRRKLKWSGTSQ
jgi:NAD+ kinase